MASGLIPFFGSTSSGNAVAATGHQERGSLRVIRIVDELKAFPVTVPAVRVLGYRAHDDLGGGVFVWSDSSTSEDDGGLVVRSLNTNTGRWIRLRDGPSRPEWFGARGDGSTDDTNGVSLALAQGGIVEFAAGRRYVVTSAAVAAGSHIRGNGAVIVQKVLARGDGRPILEIRGSDVSIQGLHFDGQRELQPQDGFSDSFDGGKGATGRAYRAAIKADGKNAALSQLRIADCHFSHVFGASVAARQCNQVSLERCVARDCNFELFMTASPRPITDVVVRDCVCAGLGTGNGIVNSNGVVVSNVSHALIINNRFSDIERNAIKLEQSCTDVVIAGNSLERNSADNFAFVQVQSLQGHASARLSILNNKARDVGAGFAFNTDRISDTAIVGNHIEGIRGPTMGDAVALAAGSVSRVTIAQNHFSRVSRQGVVVGHSGGQFAIEQVTIVDNEIALSPREARSGSIVLTLPRPAGSELQVVVTNNTLSVHEGPAVFPGRVVVRAAHPDDRPSEQVVQMGNRDASGAPIQ